MRSLVPRKVRFAPETQSRVLTRRGRRHRGALAVRCVYEIFELFARLEKGDLLRRHFHFFPGFRVPPHSAAALASAEASKATNLNLLTLLQRANNAVENSLDDRFGFL